MSFGFGLGFPRHSLLGGGYSPAQLFAGGEPGVWYDPSDLNTLFQDSAGTTPVTAVEQAVGLVLDKSRGLAIGPELVSNGDFSGGTTGWGVFAGTIAVAGGEITLTANAGAAFPQVTRTISGLTAGRMYVMTGTARRGTSADPVFISPVSGTSVQTSATSATSLRVVFTATGTTSAIGLGIFSATANGTAIFDNISVREIAGTHRIQPNAASRAILRNRYNQLTYSEQFDNAYWTKSGASITQNTAVAPDDTTTADKLVENSSNAQHFVYNTNATVISGAVYTASVYLKAAERTFARVVNFDGTTNFYGVFINLTTGAFVSTSSAGTTTNTSYAIENAGNGWWRVSVSAAIAATTRQIYINVCDSTPATNYTGNGTSGIFVWGADLRAANDTVYPYQRIAAATVYDSDTSKFPLYLEHDGSDDSYYTAANLDLSGTNKVTVFAGVSKLSDAAVGTIAETSADVDANAGSFYLRGPGTNATADYSFRAGGSTRPVASVVTTYAAPITNVLTLACDISGDSRIARINGTEVANVTSDQGTGNYGSYPLYIGRRNNATLPFRGREYQLIVRGVLSSTPDINSTERFIANQKMLRPL